MRKLLVFFVVMFTWGCQSVQNSGLHGDDVHSSITFGIGYAGGLTTVKGMFTEFTVKMDYNDSDVAKSSVTAEIPVNSVNTGNADRDKHLQSETFFDAEKYPAIKFISKKIEKKDDHYVVTGDFTMHGITKEIAFPFTIVGKAQDPQTRGTMLGFAAKFKIKRSEYGVTYGISSSAMSDEVEVEIHLLMKPEANSTSAGDFINYLSKEPNEQP